MKIYVGCMMAEGTAPTQAHRERSRPKIGTAGCSRKVILNPNPNLLHSPGPRNNAPDNNPAFNNCQSLLVHCKFSIIISLLFMSMSTPSRPLSCCCYHDDPPKCHVVGAHWSANFPLLATHFHIRSDSALSSGWSNGTIHICASRAYT